MYENKAKGFWSTRIGCTLSQMFRGLPVHDSQTSKYDRFNLMQHISIDKKKMTRLYRFWWTTILWKTFFEIVRKLFITKDLCLITFDKITNDTRVKICKAGIHIFDRAHYAGSVSNNKVIKKNLFGYPVLILVSRLEKNEIRLLRIVIRLPVGALYPQSSPVRDSKQAPSFYVIMFSLLVNWPLKFAYLPRTLSLFSLFCAILHQWSCEAAFV